jgi:hypothetical protein
MGSETDAMCSHMLKKAVKKLRREKKNIALFTREKGD